MKKVKEGKKILAKYSACLICGKKCTEDGFGRVPQLCSIECRQKWYGSWDKDWCIGVGEERAISDSLRATGYSNLEEFNKGVETLGKIEFHSKDGDFTRRKFWALLAITRDLSVELDQVSESYLNIKREAVRSALDRWVGRDQELSGDLYIALLDECVDVVYLTLNLISNNINSLPYLHEAKPKIKSVMEHQPFKVKNLASQVLEKIKEHEAQKGPPMTQNEFNLLLRGGGGTTRPKKSEKKPRS